MSYPWLVLKLGRSSARMRKGVGTGAGHRKAPASPPLGCQPVGGICNNRKQITNRHQLGPRNIPTNLIHFLWKLQTKHDTKINPEEGGITTQLCTTKGIAKISLQCQDQEQQS